MGGPFEASSLTALPIQPIWPIFAVNRLNSSNTAPRILIFSIAMGANYSIELISIETLQSLTGKLQGRITTQSLLGMG